MTFITKTVVVLASAGMFFALGGSATAQQNNGEAAKMASKKAVADDTFPAKAAEAGVLEVELGKLAVQKASNARVKQFGQRMVDDHSKIGDELREIAAKDDLVLPDQVDAGDQPIIDRLSHLSGDAFDRAYMRQMVMDHDQAVVLFQREVNGGSNGDVKSWAAGTLPTLQDHLRQAKEIENQIGGPTL